MKKLFGKIKECNYIKSYNGLKYTFVTVLVLSLLLIMPQIIMWVQAAVISKGEAVTDWIPNQSGEKGTKNNPFVILEIVPYEGYGEIGYLIDGCEPVEMDRLRYSGDMTTVTATKASSAVWGIQYQFPDEKGIPSDWITQNGEKTLYGYYERVGENEGLFQEVVDKATGHVNYVKVDNGNIVWKTVFGMTEEKVENKRKLEFIGDKVYTSRTDNQFKKGYAYAYTNHNYFLKDVLEVSENDIKDYHILVKTVESKDLNEQLEWIDRADLISISPKSHIVNLPEVWEKYNLAGKPAKPHPWDGFGNNDLSWDAVVRIFKKVNIEKDYGAIIFDWTVYTNPPTSTSKLVTPYQTDYYGNGTNHTNGSEWGNSNNVYKLALMSRTMNPVLFYNLFLNENQEALIKNGAFVNQKGDGKNYWCQSTFMPTQKDGSLAWDAHWDTLWEKFRLNPYMSGNVSVTGRIYTYNGDCTLSQNFVNDKIGETKYTEDFFDYLEEKREKNTPANAIKFILGPQSHESVQDMPLKILNIEPTNEFTLNTYRLRALLPNYIGKTDIVQMTSAEFVGKIEDLNSTYDGIYLGMNCGGYNTKSQRNPDYGKNSSNDPQYIDLPYYNDNQLDGKIYLHVGDLIKGNRFEVNWLPGGTSTSTRNTTRMPGNDITKQKKNELADFIKAGYPVLVDSKLYHTGSDLTELVVDKTSNIYALIKENKERANLLNIAELPVRNIQSKINTDKPTLLINSAPTPYKGIFNNGTISADNYINGSNINFRNLVYNYTILEKDTSKTFQVKLYIDANSDGRFEETELNMIQTGVTPNTPHKLTKRLAMDYFGVIPWKLQIVDEKQTENRDEISGFSAVKRSDSEKETIRVLQINQNGSSTTLTLQNNPQFRKFTENLKDYKIIFETKTILEFENMYSGYNNYFDITSEGTKKNTDKLKNYNMLILGFSDVYGPIKNESALNNIKYFIEKGKSVLFTHDTTSFNNESSQANEFGYYFNKDFRDILGMDRFGVRNPGGVLKEYNDIPMSPTGVLYPQIHGYNSYALKRIADNYVNLTFKGLSPSADNNITTTVTKLNQGQITQYPYVIDDTISVADTHAQYFQLNLEDPSIVVWYCLAKGNSDGSTADIYGMSPNDASSYYYIYNKGNITYSGVGHSPVGNSEMEVKLFVNTMIAAYKASIKPPIIQILNEEECVFTPDEVYGTDDILEIKFIPWDFNLSSQELGIKVQIAGGDKLEIYDRYGNKMNSELLGKDGERLIKLENGNIYTAHYKRSLFADENLRNIHFYIENKAGYYGEEELELKERVLFNLY
ncbi:DUF5057 domain-containing protein [Anaerocolumna aminovalerica]|uniref:DUF5057 domain-containing protein n=1 Tax=Anaerocolumna aminovalerica TaxID=1527 RepID=UPI000BE35489|nr:DUF5057 domain-containing protein [Anaerocolumna aminovalerica]